MDGWMGGCLMDGVEEWMDGGMDGWTVRCKGDMITAIEAAVTELVGAGVVGSICVPSDPPRSPTQQTPLGHRSAPVAGASGEIQAQLLEAGARRASELGAGCPPRAPTLC